LPIHWAVSYQHLDIAILLSAGKNFDPDIQVSLSRGSPEEGQWLTFVKDGSGWTPLMIAVSLKDGDELVELFLRKGADVNSKSEWQSS
jgi:26S proteasome non-ATPase regulatory subunit 10